MPRSYRAAPDAGTYFGVSIDPRPAYHLAAVLREVGNGKYLKTELSKNLRVASRPAVADAKAAIRAAPSRSTPSDVSRTVQRHLGGGDSLREAIATSIRPAISYKGDSVNLRIRQGSTRRVRGFRYAGRSFNRPSFRHPVYGNREKWVPQVGAPGWFDRAMQKQFYPVRAAVIRSIDAMAEKIAKQQGFR